MRTLSLFILGLCLPFSLQALTLEQDTHWQGEQSFAETVVVPQGVTLTVAPQSRIRFLSGSLEVSGRLVAEQADFSGDGWQGVLLKNCDSSTRLQGVRISNAKTGLQVQGGNPVLETLELTDNSVGLELRSKSAATITKSHFHQNRKVGLFIKDDSVATVTECLFEQNGRFGAYIYRARPARFTQHRFRGNPVGLMVAYFGSDPEIAHNHFEDNEIGLQVDRAAQPKLTRNLFVNNRTALYLYRRSDPLVSGNRFEKNRLGIHLAFSSYPKIEGNDFVDNELALKLEFQSATWEQQQGATVRAGQTSSRGAFGSQPARSVTEEDRRARTLDGTVDARGNWWGTAGMALLADAQQQENPAFIHDGRDQPTFVDDGKSYALDTVRFQPWSDQPLTGSLP